MQSDIMPGSTLFLTRALIPSSGLDNRAPATPAPPTRPRLKACSLRLRRCQGRRGCLCPDLVAPSPSTGVSSTRGAVERRAQCGEARAQRASTLAAAALVSGSLGFFLPVLGFFLPVLAALSYTSARPCIPTRSACSSTQTRVTAGRFLCWLDDSTLTC